jgi:hypothetical protein
MGAHSTFILEKGKQTVPLQSDKMEAHCTFTIIEMENTYSIAIMGNMNTSYL